MKFKTSFMCPKKDLSGTEWVLLDVNTNLEPGEILQGIIEYSVVIPQFMFDLLANSEPRFKTDYDANTSSDVFGLFSNRTLTRKFMKTQTSVSIDILKDYFNELSNIIIDKYGTNNHAGEKLIGIKYNHSLNYVGETTYGAYLGQRVQSSFHFFICYKDEKPNALIDKLIYYTKAFRMTMASSSFKHKNKKGELYEGGKEYPELKITIDKQALDGISISRFTL